jgi:hypothetical protein
MPTAPLPRIYAYMADDVLDCAIADLERVTTQDAFAFAPPTVRSAYLDDLACAISEQERRST